jgi:hypothetical protein
VDLTPNQINAKKSAFSLLKQLLFIKNFGRSRMNIE